MNDRSVSRLDIVSLRTSLRMPQCLPACLSALVEWEATENTDLVKTRKRQSNFAAERSRVSRPYNPKSDIAEERSTNLAIMSPTRSATYQELAYLRLSRLSLRNQHLCHL